jgi:hypothetical protein
MRRACSLCIRPSYDVYVLNRNLARHAVHLLSCLEARYVVGYIATSPRVHVLAAKGGVDGAWPIAACDIMGRNLAGLTHQSSAVYVMIKMLAISHATPSNVQSWVRMLFCSHMLYCRHQHQGACRCCQAGCACCLAESKF